MTQLCRAGAHDVPAAGFDIKLAVGPGGTEKVAERLQISPNLPCHLSNYTPMEDLTDSTLRLQPAPGRHTHKIKVLRESGFWHRVCNLFKTSKRDFSLKRSVYVSAATPAVECKRRALR